MLFPRVAPHQRCPPPQPAQRPRSPRLHQQRIQIHPPRQFMIRHSCALSQKFFLAPPFHFHNSPIGCKARPFTRLYQSKFMSLNFSAPRARIASNMPRSLNKWRTPTANLACTLYPSRKKTPPRWPRGWSSQRKKINLHGMLSVIQKAPPSFRCKAEHFIRSRRVRSLCAMESSSGLAIQR